MPITKLESQLADALRSEKPGEHWNPNKMVQWELDVKAIANVLRSNRKRFNAELWITYIKAK